MGEVPTDGSQCSSLVLVNGFAYSTLCFYTLRGMIAHPVSSMLS